MAEPTDLSIREAAVLLRDGRLSPVDYVTACLARIDRYDHALDAFIRVDREGALNAARDAEREIVAGRWRGPLHGVPVAIKDIVDVAGQATTAHSRVRIDHVATADAHVVAKLRAAGAIVIGKTALHEFATGGPSFDLPWPPARNPWLRTHHPGGSSSGSGVAVAAGFVPCAIGTDTGGSVRHPATVCGITGMKATYGVVGRSGAFPLAFSLDHVGPLTRDVADGALVLEAISGRDPADPASVDHAAPAFGAGLKDGVRGLRIGVLEEFGAGASAEIARAFRQACRVFEQLGAELVPIGLSPLDTYVGCGRLILQAESYAVHERWLRTRIGDYGQRGRTRLLPGAFISAADYLHAQQMRGALAREFAAALAGVDAALCVSSLELPCAIDDEAEVDRTYDRQARTPFNLTGTPALAIPMGFASSGLPMGLQVVGKAFDESMVYRVAHAYEAATDWHRRRPDLDAALAASPASA
ncbi:amidase [Piscinibacter koreensis]|uniref:Amidase n=1 Tax=Piscinibacter koreensis TaxID=2742824 RepID=A0A7Y6NNQ6_9BURK|nr:amidase [Schlegelella koreensis]NUZ06583.1 amidase [Schlegelella koreensis]